MITTNMELKASRSLYWSPRIITMIGIAFFTLLSFDVFAEYSEPADIIIAFSIHMLPALVLLVGLVIAWKNELLGAFIFNFLGLISLFFFSGNDFLPLFLTIALPLIVIGELFLLDWFKEETKYK